MPSGQLPRTLQPPPELPDDPTLSTVLAQYLRTFSLWCRHGFADKLSGTTAQPGLMLQAFNAPANALPAVWLLQVGQGGGLWVTPIAAGSGALGTPGSFQPLNGVVDGSNAPAGQIGEVISSNRVAAQALALTTSVVVNVVSIPLGPGDWDVYGEASFTAGTGGFTAFRSALTTVSATLPTDSALNVARLNLNSQPTLIAGPSTNAFIGMRPARSSSNAAVTYYLVVSADFPSGAPTVYGNIWARRAR